MSITNVWIEDGCICCGLSSDTCPEVFKIPDNHNINVVKESVDFHNMRGKLKKLQMVVQWMLSNTKSKISHRLDNCSHF